MLWKLLFNRYTLGALAVLGVVWAIYAAGAASKGPELKRRADKIEALQGDLKRWQASHKQWEDAYADLKRIREQERKDSDQALINADKRCATDLEAVRTQEEQFRRLFTKPVRITKECFVRPPPTLAPEMGLK